MRNGSRKKLATYDLCVWLLGATTKQRPQRLISLGTRHPTKHTNTYV